MRGRPASCEMIVYEFGISVVTLSSGTTWTLLRAPDEVFRAGGARWRRACRGRVESRDGPDGHGDGRDSYHYTLEGNAPAVQPAQVACATYTALRTTQDWTVAGGGLRRATRE